MSYPFETAYQACLSYAPPKVKEILANEIPKVKESVDKEILLFGESLSKHIQDTVSKDLTRLEESRKQLKTKVDNIVTEVQSQDHIEKLKACIEELKKTNDEFDKIVDNIITVTKNAVNTAIKSTGLPFDVYKS